MTEERLYCSFCGKNQHEVRRMIAGPTVFICNECVDLAYGINHDGEDTQINKSEVQMENDVWATQFIATELIAHSYSMAVDTVRGVQDADITQAVKTARMIMQESLRQVKEAYDEDG